MILTATSGDTGKAAMEGFAMCRARRSSSSTPHGGVSAVQQAQMATQAGENVCVCAVRGNFDDAQTGVKKIFSAVSKDQLLEGKGVRLSSANSINIGRLAPQVVYYYRAYADLVQAGRIQPGDKVDYVVPTGNFGDILAGYFAKEMGLPVGKLVCASDNSCARAAMTAAAPSTRQCPPRWTFSSPATWSACSISSPVTTSSSRI